MNRKQRKRREKLNRAKLKSPVVNQLPESAQSPPTIFAGAAPAHRALKAIWTAIGLVWKVVIAVGLVLSLIGAYAFQPQLSVEEKDNSLDPADVTRTPFIVKNNGLFPVYNLTFSCHEGRTLSTDPRRRF